MEGRKEQSREERIRWGTLCWEKAEVQCLELKNEVRTRKVRVLCPRSHFNSSV